jgi:hypothetical protein
MTIRTETATSADASIIRRGRVRRIATTTARDITAITEASRFLRLSKRALTLVARAIALPVFVAFCLGGCVYGERPAYHVLEGPLDAIDVTVAGGNIVVLAGTTLAKSVSVFADSDYGRELLRFPVSEFATSVRGGPGDTFFLGIGARTHGTRGAVEFWNVRGQMTASVPMPAAVLQLSKLDRGVLYALVGDGEKRAAIPLRIASSETAEVVPLPANVSSVDACRLLGARYLLTVGPTHRVQFVNVSTKAVVSTSIEMSGAGCLGTDRLVGMLDGGFGRSVQIVRLAKGMQQSDTLHAPGDAVAVTPDDSGRLLLLRRIGTDSNIQIWTQRDLTSLAHFGAARS